VKREKGPSVASVPVALDQSPKETHLSVSAGVGLLGYGHVGSAVAEQLAALTSHAHLVRALVRDVKKNRPRLAPPGLLTAAFEEIIDDPSIEIVVEVMGGLEPTKTYVEELLRAGKHVISANKQLMARHLHELTDLARLHAVSLRFEAAVGGVVPVVRTMSEALPPQSIRRVCGILNGTTNYVLSRVEEGSTFAAALATAQQKGYAEADASDDLAGHDSAAKIAILASLAFHRPVHVDGVDRCGIDTSPNKTLQLPAGDAAACGSLPGRHCPAIP
jgi:homoserine dehydrogenase